MDLRYCFLPALLALMLNAPALGQSAGFQNPAIGVSEPCSNAAADPQAKGDGVVAICQKALADLAAVRKSTPPVTGDDRNIDAFLVSAVETGLAAGYALADNRISQRVCDHAEKSWASASLVLQAMSPPSHLEAFARGHANSLKQVKECRQIFSAPPGAQPLP